VVNTSGIYILYWDIDRPYIGQTVNFNKRAQSHLNALRRNDHVNYKITREYSLYNSQPNIELLLPCSTTELDMYEEWLIEEFDSINHGLNIISGGYSVGKGVNNSMSEYSEHQILEACKLLQNLDLSYADISKITGIKRHTLGKIVNGKQHVWIKENHPDIWKNIEGTSKLRFSKSVSGSRSGQEYRKIKSPEGIIYTVINTLQFSKEHNLPNANLNQVLSGKRNSVLGWIGVD
jgi:predicted transcriptional regulator